MARPKKQAPTPRKAARTHDDLPRHSDWQNPRVVQILDAAGRCFARDGFANTTIQQIASEAGLTKSMIHYYFESKQVLILELQAFVHERYFRRVQTRLAELGPDSDKQLAEALWEVFELFQDKQFLKLQLELLAEAGRDPEMRQRMALAQERSRELVTEGAEAVVGTEGAASSPLPASLSLLISSQVLGLRILELVSGDAEGAREAYTSFVSMLTAALKRPAR